MDIPLVQLAAYIGAGIAMGFGAIGAGVGEGYAAMRAVRALARQPSAGDSITKTMLVGQAVAESSGVFALLVAFILIFSIGGGATSLTRVASMLGAGFAAGCGALGPGIGAGFAAGEACTGIGRNPIRAGILMQVMLIGQAVSQTTSVYALVVALILIFVT